MLPIISRRYCEQKLSVVAKLHRQFDAGAACFDSSDGGRHVLLDAIGYVLLYPVFLKFIGHGWRDSCVRTQAYYALNKAHGKAVNTLMREAERVGIDSGPLWDYGRVCRELLATEPWKYCVNHYHSWPDCLGDMRRTLPDEYREAIRTGECTLWRLVARAGIGPLIVAVGESNDDNRFGPPGDGALTKARIGARADDAPVKDRQADVDGSADPPLDLDATERAILAAMKGERLKVVEIAAKLESVSQNTARHEPTVHCSETTIKDRLSHLKDAGLVHRPTGKRGGFTLTVKGMAAIGDVKQPQNDR